MMNNGSLMKQNAQDLSDLSLKSGKMIRLFKIDAAEDHLSNQVTLKEKDIPDLFPWGPKILIGIDEIDNQHKELVKFINQLYKAMKMKRSAKIFKQIITGLTDYTVFHFRHEEQLFKKYHYPETDKHIKEHYNLVSEINEFKDQFEKGKAAVSMELMNFLTDWLKDHILRTDKKYVPFLKDKLV